ncbi:hypothetical protein JIG36_49200 [Actinoplanes sp. LDG1-06]|uniref:Uncharacterized protein n=1 Tax=Paractinoplanes ovalisporus TaxID=2810368 RepID=A0ABS2AUJ8_9ACTN|nr:hypothetical protein [Actinoplanes ovalisporus]MBM2623499.1 hypothetical protein [Actinoplanes ovalisporus]
MPTNTWDAVIKNLFAADDGTTNAADTVENGKPFDVVAQIEVGEDINAFAVRDQLFVAVRNLSQSTITAYIANPPRNLTPAHSRREETLKVDVSGWNARPGDLLEVVATYKFEAGVHSDHSYQLSAERVIVI